MANTWHTCMLFSLTAIAGISGVLVLLAVFAGPYIIRRQLRQGVHDTVVLTQYSPESVYERFTGAASPGRDTAPDIVKLYLWNITNVDAVRDGRKPVLAEVGPYIYRKWRVRRDVQFNREGLVSFADASWITDHKDPDGRNPADDVICTLNLPLMGVLRTIENKLNGTVKRLAELTLAEFFADRGPREGLFMRRTAKQLLFGYQDELLASLARVIPSLAPKVTFRLVENATDVAAPRPRTVMDSGLTDITRVWDFREWRGVSEITCWNNHRERIHGSDAQQFPPWLSADQSVHVFVGELFRVAKLNATEEVSVHGVKLLKYMPDDKQAEPDPRYFGEIRGLMNVSACVAVGAEGNSSDAAGPDILMSFPHFCYVDPAVSDQSVGTECDHDKHDLWLGIEPITGITMQAAKRLQVSSTFDARYPAFDEHVRPTILPIFWAEELVTIAEQDANSFKAGVYAALYLIKLLESWWLIVVGAGLVLLAAISGRLWSGGARKDLLPSVIARHAEANGSLHFGHDELVREQLLVRTSCDVIDHDQLPCPSVPAGNEACTDQPADAACSSHRV